MYEHEKLGLPKYYAVKCDGKDNQDAIVAWKKFQEIHKENWPHFYCRANYFGFDGSCGANGTDTSNYVSNFENNPTVLTPTEFLNIVNKKTMKHNLKENDAVANVTAEQLEVVKTIANQNGIAICETFLKEGLKKYPAFFFASNSEIAGTQNSYHLRNYMKFEKFILKMMGKEVFTPIEVKLNDSYTAVVTPESVKVGCQEFTHQAIKEVYEATQSFK